MVKVRSPLNNKGPTVGGGERNTQGKLRRALPHLFLSTATVESLKPLCDEEQLIGTLSLYKLHAKSKYGNYLLSQVTYSPWLKLILFFGNILFDIANNLSSSFPDVTVTIYLIRSLSFLP